MGLEPGEPIGDLLRVARGRLRRGPHLELSRHLPDRTLDIVPDVDAFEKLPRRPLSRDGSRRAAQRRFWRLQAAVGNALCERVGRCRRLPLAASPATWSTTSASSDSPGLLAASTSAADRLRRAPPARPRATTCRSGRWSRCCCRTRRRRGRRPCRSPTPRPASRRTGWG